MLRVPIHSLTREYVNQLIERGETFYVYSDCDVLPVDHPDSHYDTHEHEGDISEYLVRNSNPGQSDS